MHGAGGLKPNYAIRPQALMKDFNKVFHATCNHTFSALPYKFVGVAVY